MPEEFVPPPSKLRPKKDTPATQENNTTPLQDAQRSMVELILAYDATNEGFARALDLREHEDIGRRLRVTERTVRLAKAMKMDAAAISHLKRGAFLHDIGKMGIPDNIISPTATTKNGTAAVTRID